MEKAHHSSLGRAGSGLRRMLREGLFLAGRYPLGAFGLLVFVLFGMAAVFAGAFTWHDPLTTDAMMSLQPPSWSHPFGTDILGRDMWSRIVYGSRISLLVGLSATALCVVVGVSLGLVAGYMGGWVDLVQQRLGEMLSAIPSLVLALVVAAVLGPSIQNTIIAIAVPKIPDVARLVRALTLSLREQQFVEAARAIGVSRPRIMLRHILPNLMAPVIVVAAGYVGAAILTEASLSYLGLGVPEPHPSWGRMLSESSSEYIRTAPWLVIVPGLAISSIVFAAALLGDAIRDLLDPRDRIAS